MPAVVQAEKSIVSLEKREHQAIAIIGMHGMMPQSKDLEAFWQHLQAGDDLVTEVPLLSMGLAALL